MTRIEGQHLLELPGRGRGVAALLRRPRRGEQLRGLRILDAGLVHGHSVRQDG
jgi:hypothetical protein